METTGKNNPMNMNNRLYKIYLLFKITEEQFGQNSIEPYINDTVVDIKALKSFYAFSNFTGNELIYKVKIRTFFPKITLQSTAGSDINTLLRNVFVDSTFEIYNNIRYYQSLFRNIYSAVEWITHFKHSHTNDNNDRDMKEFTYFCLGSSPIINTANNICTIINSDNSTVSLSEYVLLCKTFGLQLKSGLAVESIEGIPYKRIASTIKSNLSSRTGYYKITVDLNKPNLRINASPYMLSGYFTEEIIQNLLNYFDVTIIDNKPVFDINYYSGIKYLTTTEVGKNLIKLMETGNTTRSFDYINIFDTTPTFYRNNQTRNTSIGNITERRQIESSEFFKNKRLKISILPNNEYYNIDSSLDHEKGFVSIGDVNMMLGLMNYMASVLTCSMLQTSVETVYDNY